MIRGTFKNVYFCAPAAATAAAVCCALARACQMLILGVLYLF